MSLTQALEHVRKALAGRGHVRVWDDRRPLDGVWGLVAQRWAAWLTWLGDLGQADDVLTLQRLGWAPWTGRAPPVPSVFRLSIMRQ
jgi:hypothetical protein